MLRKRISIIVLSYLFGSSAFAQNNGALTDTFATQDQRDVSEEITVSFSGKKSIIKYDAPYSLFIADMNLDGNQDIVFNSFKFPTEILPGRGNGFFASGYETSEDASDDRRIFPAYMNGDSLVDILSCGERDENRILWRENTRDSGFLPPVIISSEVDHPIGVFAIDLDGDSDQDVISLSDGDNKVAWYENDGRGSFGPQNILDTTETHLTSVYADDLDGDGKNDILFSSIWGGYWFRNEGGGKFSERLFFDTSIGGQSVRTSDMDGDGDKDIITADYNSRSLIYYQNIGTNGFSRSQIITPKEGARPLVSFPADLNNDGFDDIIAGVTEPDRIIWFKSDGQGGFGQERLVGNQERMTSAFAASDLDGDNDLDIVFGTLGVAWYENTGVSITLDVKREAGLQNRNLLIHPNPALNRTKISFNSPKPGHHTLQVFNMLGSLIETFDMGISTFGQNEYYLDVSNYLGGVYLITLSNEEEVIGLGQVLVQ